MISTVPKDNYEILRKAFYDSISNYPLINSVLANLQEGFVYSDEKYSILIVVTKSGFSYTQFTENNDANFELVFDFLQNNMVIPNYIHLYEPDNLFLAFIEKKWDKFKVRERVQYRFANRHYQNIQELLPENYSIETIQNVSFQKLSVFNLNLDGRYWNSFDDFNHYSIGACILDENKNPAAICYAAAVIDGIAEMDTLVIPEHRGKGFMRIVSLPFFNIAKEKSYITHWDTFVSNTASYIMGDKFKPDSKREYLLLSILLNDHQS
jgi:hypothetical protein